MKLGDLSTLIWQEGYLNTTNPKNDVVHIHYAALNFRDCMLATGRISKESISASPDSTRLDLEYVLGMEYAGVCADTQKRVIGVRKSGAFANKVEVNPHFVFECPPNWSLEEAVTVPVVYSTVYCKFSQRF